MNLFLIAIISYLIGSIPFSLLIAKLKGVDLGSSGTKNLGGSNVALTTGFKFGILAIVLDMSKGFIPVIMARILNGTDPAIFLAGIASILGHDFPLFLKFKGGKGLATTGGVFLAINPYVLFINIILYGIVYYLIIKKFIPTTLIVLSCLPIIVWFLGIGQPYVFLALCSTVLIYYTHRKDIGILP